MTDEFDPVLLAKWIAGELTPDDRQALDRWLAEDPRRQGELEAYRALWRRAESATAHQSREDDQAEAAGWARLRQTIRAGAAGPRAVAAPNETLQFPFARRRPWVVRSAVAAGLVVLAGTGVWLGFGRRAATTVAAAPALRLRETARGERAEFRLSDGTRVMLNVASRLRIPATYGQGDRTIYLEGGAYFDVAHDDRRPFVVHAGGLVARDVGTEFVVQAYPEDSSASVVVRSGIVGLRTAESAATAERQLVAGQLGRRDAENRIVVEPADTAATFAWTGGTLVIDGMPLRQVLPQLSRWFDLEFELADPRLADIPVTAVLTNQPTDAALSFLAASLGLRAVRRGPVVVFERARPRP